MHSFTFPIGVIGYAILNQLSFLELVRRHEHISTARTQLKRPNPRISIYTFINISAFMEKNTSRARRAVAFIQHLVLYI
jgi:hypothetical protein